MRAEDRPSCRLRRGIRGDFRGRRLALRRDFAATQPSRLEQQIAAATNALRAAEHRANLLAARARGAKAGVKAAKKAYKLARKAARKGAKLAKKANKRLRERVKQANQRPAKDKPRPKARRW